MVIKLLHSGRHGNLWSKILDSLELKLVSFEAGENKKNETILYLSLPSSFLYSASHSLFFPLFLSPPS
jgi:hypothetical protein